MSMAEVLTHYWTPDEVRALPDDGKRYECVDGELLVTAAPTGRHQRAVGLLWNALFPYVARSGAGELLMSPADLEIEAGALVQPDLFVYRIPAGGIVQADWSVVRSLRLAVEILSPSTARYDRGIKRHFYLRSPTDEYWIVDLESRVVERWRTGDDRPEICVDELVWSPDGAVAPLRIDLPPFFAAVFGEPA
jgi:Uma2 family endonuclease